MRHGLRLPALLLAIAGAAGAAETSVERKPFEYPYEVFVYDLPAAANGVKYRLYVRPPLREPGEGEAAASFYFLDAIANFAPAAAMTFNYEHFNYLPAAYYIGIGYQDEADGIAKEKNRTRDYTPTKFTPPDASHFLASSPASHEGSGGATAFLDVLEQEIIPFVESRFEVDEHERVLIGSSLGGLAAVHALLTRPGLFERYLIISPSIWWDDWSDARHERYVMKTARQNEDRSYPRETRAYFAVGSAEERLGMVTDLYVLTNALASRGDDNLKVRLEVLDGEMHEGIFPAAFMRGIVGLYAGDPERRESASRIRW